MRKNFQSSSSSALMSAPQAAAMAPNQRHLQQSSSQGQLNFSRPDVIKVVNYNTQPSGPQVVCNYKNTKNGRLLDSILSTDSLDCPTYD